MLFEKLYSKLNLLEFISGAENFIRHLILYCKIVYILSYSLKLKSNAIYWTFCLLFKV